jgi:hypothetical protein
MDSAAAVLTMSISMPLPLSHDSAVEVRELSGPVQNLFCGSALKSPPAVRLVDVKEINDRFGHAEGARLLKTLGETAVGFLRRSDCLFRVGADEFLALLWPADDFTAQTVAEWVRRALEEAASERAAGMQLRDGHIQSCFKFS